MCLPPESKERKSLSFAPYFRFKILSCKTIFNVPNTDADIHDVNNEQCRIEREVAHPACRKSGYLAPTAIYLITGAGIPVGNLSLYMVLDELLF